MSYEMATFAAGCFWHVQEQFARVYGVAATRTGYTGGKAQNPTYEEVCHNNTGHAEAVEVTYDPQKVSYQKLLGLFFSMHNPGSVIDQGPGGRGQYRAAAFYHNPEQKGEIERAIALLEKGKKHGSRIHTQVAPAGIFWPAESHHQHYYRKNR